jgi:hypothetical protein
MKNLLLSVLLLSAFQVFASVNVDTLKNATIIKMTTSKLGDNLILSSINKSPVKFDISPDSGEVVSYADGGQLKEHFGIEE